MAYSLKVVSTDCSIVTTGLKTTVFETGGLTGKDRDHFDLTSRTAPCHRELCAVLV
jgi:hypothetical protein